MPPVVLSGDLVASRAYGADEAARTLAGAVKDVNTRFQKELSVPLDVIQGDAFQGVARNGAAALTIAFWLQGRLADLTEGKLKSRFGFGLGAIDQPLTGVDDPSLLTGPAFVAAAEALALARKEKRQLVFKGGKGHLDEAVNGALGLVEHVWDRWSAEVWRRALRYHELKDIGRLAQELDVSYQAVHKQLHKRGVLAILEALGGLGTLLEDIEA